MKHLITVAFLLCSFGASFAVAADTDKQPVHSKVAVDFYGYLKFDVARDDGTGTYPGDYSMYANPKTGPNGPQLNMTANQSRFGFNFSGPTVESMTTTGKLETDFYAFTSPVNKALPMMRHAYILLGWKDHDMSVLAGQTSDIISPLAPSTLNYLVLWGAGNIGYRRPQVQVQKGYMLGDTRLNLQLGLARTISASDLATNTATYGNDSAQPTYEWRLSASRSLWLPEKMEIGLSGHYATEHFLSADTGVGGMDQRFISRSINLDLQLPVWEKLVFKGELFTGKNLGTFFGGINQGINTAKKLEIRSYGGWGELSVPYESWKFAGGYGLDNPNDDDLSAGNRAQNEVYFVNAVYPLSRALNVGLELSRWRTEFLLNDEATAANRIFDSSVANRYQASIQYNF